MLAVATKTWSMNSGNIRPTCCSGASLELWSRRLGVEKEARRGMRTEGWQIGLNTPRLARGKRPREDLSPAAQMEDGPQFQGATMGFMHDEIDVNH